MPCCCKPEVDHLGVTSKKRCVNTGERVALLLEGVQVVEHFLYCRLCSLKDFFLTLNWRIDFGRMWKIWFLRWQLSNSLLTIVYAEFLPTSGLKASENLNFPGNRLHVDACLYLYSCFVRVGRGKPSTFSFHWNYLICMSEMFCCSLLPAQLWPGCVQGIIVATWMLLSPHTASCSADCSFIAHLQRCICSFAQVGNNKTFQWQLNFAALSIGVAAQLFFFLKWLITWAAGSSKSLLPFFKSL